MGRLRIIPAINSAFVMPSITWQSAPGCFLTASGHHRPAREIRDPQDHRAMPAGCRAGLASPVSWGGTSTVLSVTTRNASSMRLDQVAEIAGPTGFGETIGENRGTSPGRALPPHEIEAHDLARRTGSHPPTRQCEGVSRRVTGGPYRCGGFRFILGRSPLKQGYLSGTLPKVPVPPEGMAGRAFTGRGGWLPSAGHHPPAEDKHVTFSMNSRSARAADHSGADDRDRACRSYGGPGGRRSRPLTERCPDEQG